MISLTTFLIAFAIGAIFLFLNKGKRGKLPPGPLSLPIIGSMLSLGKQPYKKFKEFGDIYPEMFSIGFGAYPTVVINDIKIIREAFNDPRFSGRPDMELLSIFSDGKHGVINSEGQEWVEQRRFTLRHLRDFGFGKKTMETMILDDVNEFVSYMKSVEGQPVSHIMRRFNLIVINSLWTIISGNRHSHEDPAIVNIMETFTKVKDSFGFLTFFAPSLAKRIPNISGWGLVEKIVSLERSHMLSAIEEHRKNPPQDGVARDFMDVYLNEIKTVTDPASSFHKERGIQSLLAVSLDLFNAGNDTTSTTLTWTILYLAKLQFVQKKLQAEVDSVVGRSRQVSVADRKSMPYAEALFLEILRYSSIVVFGLFHTTVEDVKDFHGYDFPKGTIVTANHYYVHHSSKYWDEPEEFKPERFLTEDGKTVKKPEAFIPFSVGKRACLGETLARDEVFLFMTNIFQRFNVKLTESSKNVNFEHRPGVNAEPFDFSVIFTERS